MDRRHRRCGAAAAAIALLVADVQGFAFTLQLSGKNAAPVQQQALVGRARGATREVCGRGRASQVASRAVWSSRQTRTTVVRMVSDESPTPSGAPGGGATAAEVVLPEGGGVSTSSGGGGGGGDGEKEDEEHLKATEQSEKLRLTAEKLKLQAEKLRLEVEKEQLMLQSEKLQDKEIVERKQDALIAQFRALHGRDDELTALVKTDIRKVNAELFMRLADIAETATEVEERDSLVALSEDLMRAVDRVDKGKAVKVSREIKETLDRVEEIDRATRARAAAQALVAAQNTSYGSELLRGDGGNVSLLNLSLGNPSSRVQDLRNLAGMGVAGENITEGMPAMPDVMNVMFLPLWVPTALLKFVGSAPALLDADIEAVKTDVFGMDTFYVTDMEKSPFAALYKGNMRGKSSEEVFEKVTEKLDSIPGLGDRVQLFLMGDPTPLTPEEAVQQRSKTPDPVFMVISKEAMPQKNSLLSVGGAAVTLAGTAFTAFAYGIGNFALRPEFYQKINDGDTSVAALALPIMAGVLALQAVHELGHWAAAGNKDVKIGSPIFIPSLQLGLFGAITPLLSFPKNRKQYFDVAAAGPLLGSLVSIAVFVAGILMTGAASAEALTSFPLVPAGLFHSSLLVGMVTSLGLPSVMSQAVTTTVAVHPLAIVGITGVIVNALNLMPIGSLDGGRIAMSTFGRKAGGVLGTVTLLLQAVSAVFNNYSLQLFWGLLVILFQRGQDLPARDELTEVDDGRVVMTIVLLLFSLVTLVPFPDVF